MDIIAWRATIIFILTLLLGLAGCASRPSYYNQGVEHYNAGNFVSADAWWRPCAEEGDANCQYGMGLLYKQGLGNTPKDQEEALRWFEQAAYKGLPYAMYEAGELKWNTGNQIGAVLWFNEGARWGNEPSISFLTQLNLPVPPPDLLERQQAERQQKMDEQVAASICLLAGGCPTQGLEEVATCKGVYCSYTAAWDYLPGSGQWRCRVTSGLNGGQFTDDTNCTWQAQVDNWY